MHRVALGIAWCAALACAAPPSSPVRTAERSRAPSVSGDEGRDRALELAQLLPAGADRCVIARPRRVPAARRALLARVSQAEPFAWAGQLEIEAYASVQLERRDGPSGQVVLLWMRDADRARTRAQISAHAGLDLHWEDERGPACSPSECPVRARFDGEHLVRIERGPFVSAARAGVELQCAGMAERSPAAVEVSVARSRTFGSFTFGGLPVRASAELRAHATFVHVTRIERMRDPIEAERALTEGLTSELLLPRAGSLGSNLQRTREGEAIRTEFDLAWDDLALAREDDVRLQAVARDSEALLAQAPPAAAALPARREDVLAELGYRLELMQRVTGEQRTAEAQAARSLLERALEQAPEDEALALLLAELILSEYGEAASVRGLVQRFAGREGVSRGWKAVERHAAALSGEGVLAGVLVRQKLVERQRARAAAQAIVQQMREGASFERAERAALGQTP